MSKLKMRGEESWKGGLMDRPLLQVAREVLDAAARAIKPGVTTDEIDRVVHEATISVGMQRLPSIS